MTTMFGRRRPVPELSSSNFMQRSFGERVAMNAPIQGTAADIIKIAMIRVHDRLLEEHLKSRLIITVHDELLIETAEDEIDRVKEILIPYTIPKFTALAFLRCKSVTSSNGMWNTCDAVILWISCASLYASISFSSSDMCANTRSSIFE